METNRRIYISLCEETLRLLYQIQVLKITSNGLVAVQIANFLDEKTQIVQVQDLNVVKFQIEQAKAQCAHLVS